jgi:hypothetical protein
MSLKDSIKNDAITVFLSNDEFAEQATYKPRSGGSRTILAIVDREPPSLLDDVGNVVALSFVVYVKNDATTGIHESELDTGGDKVEVMYRGSKTSHSILKVTDSDFGMLQIALK